jgi:hypothetical protein
MIKIASKIYGWLLKISGYSVFRLEVNGSEHYAITTDLAHVKIKRVGNVGGYWIDTATGMVVVPVWFK